MDEKLKFGTMMEKVEIKGDIMMIINKLTSKEKYILIRDIVSIELQKPGLLQGYVRFQIMDQESSQIVLSNNNQYNAAIKMRDYIQDNQAVQTKSNGKEASPINELLKFKQLFDEGAITFKEFNRKKKQLLYWR